MDRHASTKLRLSTVEIECVYVYRHCHICSVPHSPLTLSLSLSRLRFGIHSIVCFPFISDSFVSFLSHHPYKHWIRVYIFFLMIFAQRLYFATLSCSNPSTYPPLHTSRSYSYTQALARFSPLHYLVRFTIDLIWFIRITSGFDIPKEISFIWPRLTYFQWKIMFKWWKKIPVVLLSEPMYLNGVKRWESSWYMCCYCVLYLPPFFCSFHLLYTAI